MNKLDGNERNSLAIVRDRHKSSNNGECYTDLITELMDESYNNIRKSNFEFDNMPPMIPPVIGMTTNRDLSQDSSSSSSNMNNETMGYTLDGANGVKSDTL